jgi:hypothetical protein
MGAHDRIPHIQQTAGIVAGTLSVGAAFLSMGGTENEWAKTEDLVGSWYDFWSDFGSSQCCFPHALG